MTRSKTVVRKVPQRNVRYLPKNAIVLGGVKGMKGYVLVRLDLDWVRRSDSKYKVLFRGELSPL
jgi:hypothetical protein